MPTSETFPIWQTPGACDCHSHIYGPYSDYPLPAGHTPPAARTLAAYENVLEKLGVERSIFVQALAYGTDHRAMLAAMAVKGAARARGVAIVSPSTDEDELRKLNDAGVRGARIMTTEAGAASLQDVPSIARLIAPFGWHLVMQGDGASLDSWLPVLRDISIPVVIDHVGRLPRGGGIDHPAFDTLLTLLDRDNIWLKLSAFYYGFAENNDETEVALRVRTLAVAHPERMIWGLNWPHPRYADERKPDDATLFKSFLSWLTDEGLCRAILVDNPARLYGFS